MRPNITKEDAELVSERLQSGLLVMGDKVEEFENMFAEYVGAKYAVAVESLTSGFVAVVDMLEPTVANLPTCTYVSMANTLKKFNVNITFRDEWIAGKEYIIPTDKGNIVDSAHNVEKDICKKSPESIWLFSFHATKLIATGKGGMIVTNSKPQADFLRTLIHDGRIYANNTYEYVVHNAGWNAYMTDIEAILGIEQLKRFDKTNKRRDEVIELYKKYLKPHQYDKPSRYIYQVYIDNFNGFKEVAKENGIQVSKHFNPIHLQPAFRVNGKFDYSVAMAQHLISIPFYPSMKEEDIKFVSQIINDWRNNVTS